MLGMPGFATRFRGGAGFLLEVFFVGDVRAAAFFGMAAGYNERNTARAGALTVPRRPPART